MGKNHIKSLNAPSTWAFNRKENTFITRPTPGPHTFEHTVSISFFLKHVVSKVTTKKEAKYLLRNGELLIDGKKRYDEKAQVGLMDVVTFPKVKENYVILLNRKNKLSAVKIDDKAAALKIVKIKSKTIRGSKKIQLNCTSGRNITVEKDSYKIGDSIVISAENQKIVDTFPFNTGANVLLTSGKRAGSVGTLTKIQENMIQVKADKEFETPKECAFVIGNLYKPA